MPGADTLLFDVPFQWNEQFGDAGTKKNKKSGFGGGFGFGTKTDEVKK